MKTNLTRLKFTLVILLALASNFVKAQTCTANFVYSVGANGYTTFSAIAVPSPTNYYYWGFGGGGATYTNVNTAAFTYTANGYYLVYLMIIDAPFSCSTSTNILIHVNTTTNTPTCPSVTPSFVYAQGSNGSVTFVSTSSGSLTNALYMWAMGDGTTIYSQSVIPLTYNYTANSTYQATLTILVGSNPACAYTTTAPIVVNTTSVTLCALSASCTSSLSAGGAVQFSNTSTGTSNNVGYSWNFGDGSAVSSFSSPTHTYTSNGTYTVTLTANNNYTSSCTSTFTTVVNVSSACNVSPGFTYSSTSNGDVTFSNVSTGTNTGTSYYWTFGDGGTSTVAAPTHTYANSGTYTVTLQADATTNSVFPCVGTASQAIVITNTCIPNTGFTLMPSGTPQYWYAVVGNTTNVAAAEWSWGDSSPNSPGIVTSHSYAAAGTYSICLNVTLTCGASGTSCTSQYLNKTQAGGADIVYVNCLTEDMLETGIGKNWIDKSSGLVAPNPNSGEFTIRLTGSDALSAKVVVYNSIGEGVFETRLDLINGQLSKNLVLENVAGGVYFIKVNVGNQLYTQKVIVNR